MNLMIKITVRSWATLLLLLVVSACVASPWWVADWTDEYGVAVWVALLLPILVGAIAQFGRRYLDWVVS